MKKNKAKLHTGGKSILHVRNSSGGFCKVKKRGRIGKTCIYFDDEKKTCKFKEGWCNSSTCYSYKKKRKVNT